MNLKKLNRIELRDYFSFDLRIDWSCFDKKLDDINQVNISKQQKLSFLLFISSTVYY